MYAHINRPLSRTMRMPRVGLPKRWNEGGSCSLRKFEIKRGQAQTTSTVAPCVWHVHVIYPRTDGCGFDTFVHTFDDRSRALSR